MRKKIGECLVQAGVITDADLQAALAEHGRTGERVGAALVRLALATEQQVARAVARQLGFPYVSLAEEPPDPAALVRIPKAIALERVCVGVRLRGNHLTVATCDPLLFSLVQDLEFQTGCRVTPVVATRTDILAAIAAGYSSEETAPSIGGALALHSRGGVQVISHAGSAPRGALVSGEADRSFERPPFAAPGRPAGGGQEPIVDLVDLMMHSAIAAGASDVHIEPAEKGTVVRHRVDGLLREAMDFPRWVHEGLVARVKIMSGMDIAEKRLPQDGRLRLSIPEGRRVDFRVSTLRTLFGEKIVLRVLDHRRAAPPLEELGLSPAAMAELRSFLRHQHGMILVVGPTGSGKTTTLSGAIAAISSGRTNIITIEDPIEYEIHGVNQTQVNEKAKLTFAAALRAILRQDPDVILVGEIRDHETAKIALQAAQTGHLVLSTLHTDDAPSAVTRLMDMRVEPYVIASALVGVVAQRLVRRLCPECRRPHDPDDEALRWLNIVDREASGLGFHRAVGCAACGGTGYRGRIALYEVMRVTDGMRRQIAQRSGEDAIRDLALGTGMITLGDDGLDKAKAGVTSLDELMRVVTEVREVRTPCPSCAEAIGVDFKACPHCGHRIAGGCHACGRVLRASWAFCPSCAAAVAAAAPPAGRPGRSPAVDLGAPKVTEFRALHR